MSAVKPPPRLRLCALAELQAWQWRWELQVDERRCVLVPNGRASTATCRVLLSKPHWWKTACMSVLACRRVMRNMQQQPSQGSLSDFGPFVLAWQGNQRLHVLSNAPLFHACCCAHPETNTCKKIMSQSGGGREAVSPGRRDAAAKSEAQLAMMTTH